MPAWYLQLVPVLGNLSRCLSMRDVENFAIHHDNVLTVALSLDTLSHHVVQLTRGCGERAKTGSLSFCCAPLTNGRIKQSRARSAAADGWPGWTRRSTRSRAGKRCRRGDLASDLG